MNYIYKILNKDNNVTELDKLPLDEQEKIKEQLSQKLADSISVILARS